MKVVKGAKGGRTAQVQTKIRLTPDTRSHRSKEAKRLSRSPVTTAHPAQVALALQVLEQGRAWREKRKGKQKRRRKGLLDKQNPGEVCCEQAASEGVRKDL